MPMSHAERGRLGSVATVARTTPEQRREIARKAHLASAVNAVVNRAPELSADQVAKLRAVFAPAVGV
ncbi:hypothetical protein ACFOOK_07550 [Micromonospora krabiensis]|uniref:Uncharacterized protein n=1 Tax=Micromonospora krabiensis TaxID=307121 RepID=A0A1C3NC16_9ACTN|nr:hypothetical protein [Micromonospora krabiensis]SBV30147.1 hypothetical protein GA0070620_5740 [Micromonospora krabiensis]